MRGWALCFDGLQGFPGTEYAGYAKGKQPCRRRKRHRCRHHRRAGIDIQGCGGMNAVPKGIGARIAAYNRIDQAGIGDVGKSVCSGIGQNRLG